ncbi:MAG: hypothetical protein A2126_02100 [Candidatus Woykebacteria bacterium GWB1_45_5]|uniref:DUF1648 domain-containing protein n=2 Tax=Candidatus Woykeibacteriota TaxID=1817899 RepID=A0A1G1W111_9BACT|nr:MAG: hypothetical protein A2113_00050 [Candidatus Woykebacteria bacterium GWA1_44_8]OGY24568.1 MAG: hypothetical protein A2126_02100 [Candidatus Woykebacteria bacterium GWB1_45_5]
MKTRRFTKLFRLPPTNILILLAAFSLIFVSCLLIWTKSPQFPLAVPLWFSREWGEKWLAAPIFLWILPLMGFLTIIVNSLLAHLFWTRERPLSLILLGNSLIVSVLFLYSLLSIILVVT